MKAFRWTGKRERAALLVAQDELSDQAIADSLGIAEVTLERWKRAPEFRARAAEHVEAWRQALRQKGIADKRSRLAALDDRWRRLQKVIDERAEHHPKVEGAHVSAGAETGALVLTIRHLPGGGRVEEWAVDTALFAELRAHEKQAAIELGEWTERSEVKQSGGLTHTVKPDLSHLSLEELRTLEHILGRRADAEPGPGGDRDAEPR